MVLGHSLVIVVLPILFWFANVSGVTSECMVDLDDQDLGNKAHYYYANRSYTKKKDDVTYYCASMCDHCCANEGYCCDPTADTGRKGVTQNHKCLEDESGNIHMANCGFRMLCCTDSQSLSRPKHCDSGTGKEPASSGTGIGTSSGRSTRQSPTAKLHCLVDLDDQSGEKSDHTGYEKRYTKEFNGFTYTCVSMCDHCCTSEPACCDGSKNGKNEDGPGESACMEDESANAHMSGCGFKMLCCTHDSLLPDGDCPDYGWVPYVVLLAIGCIGASSTAIGIFCCYKMKCCCWQQVVKLPTNPNYPQGYPAAAITGPVTVVGQPVMGASVVEAPVKG